MDSLDSACLKSNHSLRSVKQKALFAKLVFHRGGINRRRYLLALKIKVKKPIKTLVFLTVIFTCY